MVTIIKNSILVGFLELRVSGLIVIPFVLFAYFVLDSKPAEIPVVIGVPLLLFLLFSIVFTRLRLVMPTQQPPAGESDEKPQTKKLSKAKHIVYGTVLFLVIVSLFWTFAFLFSAPIYPALGISPWVAFRGFGWMVLLFLISSTLLVFVAILEVWKFTTLLRKILYSAKTILLPSLYRLPFRFGHD